MNNQVRNFNRDYKLIICRVPDTNITFVYIYHYKIGFSASFNSISDAKMWVEGYMKNGNSTRILYR